MRERPTKRWKKAEQDHGRISFALSALERIRAEVEASMTKLRAEAHDAFAILCNLRERGWSGYAPAKPRARDGRKRRSR